MASDLESKVEEEAFHLARLEAFTQQHVVCCWWGEDQPKAVEEVALKYRISIAVSKRNLFSQTCAAVHR